MKATLILDNVKIEVTSIDGDTDHQMKFIFENSSTTII